MEVLYVIDFLITLEKLILGSQSHILSYLIEIQMYSLLVKCWKSVIQRFQLCMGLNTLYPYFSVMFPKSQLWIRCLQLIRQYTTYLVLAYITNIILYLNQNKMDFTIGTLVCSVSMIPGWMVIIMECTDIFAWEKHFSPQFLLLNSTLFHWTKNSPK